MRWADWAPLYGEIVRDFGFSRADDEAARDLLASLLAARFSAPRGLPTGPRGGAEAAAPSPDATGGPDSPTVEARLRRAFGGRAAVVVGAGRPVDPASLPRAPVAVADKAVGPFVRSGGEPALVVTDLDGDVALQAGLNARGVPLAVHAHGDNRDALAHWVPRLAGPVLGTTQAEPRPPLVNAGGFTDGDRAAFLVAWLGASEVVLAGFDFEHAADERKRRKLAWARRLLDRLDVPWRQV